MSPANRTPYRQSRITPNVSARVQQASDILCRGLRKKQGFIIHVCGNQSAKSTLDV